MTWPWLLSWIIQVSGYTPHLGQRKGQMQAQLKSVRTSSPVNWGKANRRHAPFHREQSYPVHPFFWNSGSLLGAPALSSCGTVPGHTLTNSFARMNSGMGDRELSLFNSCTSNFILFFSIPPSSATHQNSEYCTVYRSTGTLRELHHCTNIKMPNQGLHGYANTRTTHMSL